MNLRSVGRGRADADVVFSRALEQVRAVPGITEAAVAATVPFGQSFGASLAIAGPDSIVHGNSMLNVVTPGYFRTLGARVLTGRDFQASDGETSPRVVIISEILARRYWKDGNPIGRCIRLGADTTPCMEVVGVVENVRRQSIFEDSTGFVYLALAQARNEVGSRQLVARVNGTSPSRSIETIRRAMQTAAAQLPFADVHLVADEPTVRQQLRPFRLGATMFGIFGTIALILAAVGVYGVVAYDVAQRTQEIGVRVALGAQGGNVARLVVGGGVRVVSAGVIAGIAVALVTARFIAPLLYQIPPRDPVVLSLVSATLLVSAIVACVVPAWRAMRVDAVVALRSE
jgi:predicted permease